MSVLVDYRCDACGATSERFVSNPIPAASDCGICGEPARRVYGVGGLLGVRPRKAANERLARERAERVPSAGSHHDHHHDHGHHHDHQGHGHGDVTSPSPPGSPGTGRGQAP